MVGSDFCELPGLCDALINHTITSIRRAHAEIAPVSVLLFIDLEFYQNMISIFQFFSARLIKHRVYTDSFTSLQIWSGFIVYCPEPSAIEHTGLKSHKRRRGAFIYKFLRNYNSEWWSQDAQPSSHPTGPWVPGIINRVVMDNKISIRRILCLISAKDPSLA